MGWESFGVVGFDLGPLLQSWPGNLLVWSDMTLDPLLQGQMRIAKLKSAYNSLIIDPRGLGW